MNELQALQNLYRAVVALNNTPAFDPDKAEKTRVIAEWIKIAEGVASLPYTPPIDHQRVRMTKRRLPKHYQAAKEVADEHEILTATQLKKDLSKRELYTGPNGLHDLTEALEYDGIVSPPDKRGRRISYRAA